MTEIYYILDVTFRYRVWNGFFYSDKDITNSYECASIEEIDNILDGWKSVGQPVHLARIVDSAGDNPYEGKTYSHEKGWV